MTALPREHLPDSVINAYKQTLDPNAFFRATAFRQLQGVVHAINQAHHPQRILFVFDEFERMVKLMPPSFFINLRALRDELRYTVLYMTVSRKEIYNLAQGNESLDAKLVEAQSFHELFKSPIYMRAAEQGDCIELVRNLNSRVRLGQDLSWDDYNLLTTWIKGHSGLLRTGLMILDSISHRNQPIRFARTLLSTPEIQQECAILLESCTPRELTLLELIADIARHQRRLSDEDEQLYSAEIQTLYQKNLLDNDETSKYRISPPILYHYMFLRDWIAKNTRPYMRPANPRPNSPDFQPPEAPLNLHE